MSRKEDMAFLGIAAFFLLTKPQAYAWGALPYLLLLACPLLHFFMHGGHGRGRHGQSEGRRYWAGRAIRTSARSTCWADS